MIIVITGATSFIGRHLITKLIDEGHKCIAIVRPGRKSVLKGVDGADILELAMDQYSKLASITGKVDCLINLAWLGTRGSDRMNTELQRLSYEYSMDALRSYGDEECKTFITAGSQAEYGPHDGQISESDELKPNTEYGKYKAKLFKDAFDYCSSRNMRMIEPRFFSLYGPGDYEKTMVVNILKKMASNEPCDLTLGIQKWDFLYIDDAIDALSELLKKGSSSGAYNFASGDVRELRDYINEMKEVSCSTSELNYGAVSYPETGMVSIIADISKLTSETGWSAKTPFSDGIKAVLSSL